MRKIMKEKNKPSKKKNRLREYLRDEYIDKDGYGVIDINIYEGFSLYDPLSMGVGLELNPEIYDFIYRKSNIIPAKIPLKIRFHGIDPDEEEQEKIVALIEEHYTVKKYDIEWDLHSNSTRILSLVLIGVAFLALYFLLETLFDNLILLEVLSIIGTFSIWEAVDYFLIERTDLKKEYLNNKQSLEQKIEFASI